ncbi:IPT/TIG domain-containing protein [Archangium violaceum]|uniref:IPT/TIG domain-containing protein n=1 Tax=Archangium violaceum TaxID=83451 RepID=UPI0036D86004
MNRLWLALFLAWAAMGLVACSTECGPGTHLEGRTCVPDAIDAGGGSGGYSCGPGTHASGGMCVPDGTDGGGGDGGSTLSCGPGTHAEGSLCLPGEPIDSIEVSPSSASLRPGQTQAFTAVAKYHGTVVSGVGFDWSSSTPGTATINGSGVATAVAAGSTQITAAARGVTSSPATLTVTPGPSASLTSLSPTSAPPGAPITLNGSQFGLTQGTTQVMFGTTAATSVLSWSDTRIVVRVPVDLTPGTVDVKLQFPSGSSNSLSLTVTSGAYVISVTPNKAVQGSKVRLFLSGTNLGSCSVALNRAGSPDSSITVDNAGKIVERAGAPGLPDLVQLNVDVGSATAVGDLAVSCGSSTTALTADNRFSVTYREGTITASVGSGTVGFSGDGGPVTSARLNGPSALALGNSGELYIADTGNHRIRVANRTRGPLTIAGITVPAGTIASLAGGGGVAGDTDPGYAGDGGPVVSARLDTPSGLAYDSRGLLFIADTGNHVIRVINVGTAEVMLPGGPVAPGAIARVAGAGKLPGYAGDGGAALPGSRFNGPAAVAVDGKGLLYVADTNNNRLRVVNVSTDVVSNGLGTFDPGFVSLVAGSSAAGAAGDKLPASSTTQLNAPAGLVFDASSGLLAVADTGNNKVRVINTTLASVTFGGPPASVQGLGITLESGYITTAVGAGGAASFSGDGDLCGVSFNSSVRQYLGQQCSPFAGMAAPVGLSVGPFGQLFIADQNNGRIRLAVLGDAPVQRAGTWFYSGTVTTLAGNGTSTSGIGAGDGGPAGSASLFGPLGLAWSGSNGTLYVADTLHHRIREVLLELPQDPFSGSSGPWPSDFTSGTATLDVDTGILSYDNGTGPAEYRFGQTSGVFAISGKLRIYPGTTLRLTGSRPAALAATGDVQIDGIIQAMNGAMTSGPGYSDYGGPGHGGQGPPGAYCSSLEQPFYADGHPYGNPSLVPVTPATAGMNGGGALVLSAGVPGSSASLKVTGAVHADSGYNKDTCITGGSGGGVRLVATGSISVTGTLSAGPGGKPTCCIGSYRPAEYGAYGRLRMEAPVVTATGIVSPAASISTTTPLPPPWM